MPTTDSLPQILWSARVPLHITHASHPATPFITSVPRFSYLALLLPRLSAFFGMPCEGFWCEGVELRNLCVGLLWDLYGYVGDDNDIERGGYDGGLGGEQEMRTGPWRLVVGEGGGWDIGDTFLNCVKEADFIRNGNANQIMKMSKAHTTQLWNAVKDNDYPSFSPIFARLLNAPTQLKNVPIRVYIPTASTDGSEQTGSYRVVQTLVAPVKEDRRAKTLGEGLGEMLPGLFGQAGEQGRVKAVMHGGKVPMGAPLGELMREAVYPDGWLCLVVIV